MARVMDHIIPVAMPMVPTRDRLERVCEDQLLAWKVVISSDAWFHFLSYEYWYIFCFNVLMITSRCGDPGQISHVHPSIDIDAQGQQLR